MTSNGQYKWEIHNEDDERIKSMLTKLKEEASGDLHKFCKDKAIELLTGHIMIGCELYKCDYQLTLDILKFLSSLVNSI